MNVGDSVLDMAEEKRGKDGRFCKGNGRVDKDVFIPKKDLRGLKVGHLLVVDFAYKKNQQYYYKCLCDCGNECIKSYTTILKGKHKDWKSCGCLLNKLDAWAHTTHNGCGTPEYRAWQGIIKRCCNKKNKAYPRYGGRGITVCDRWRNSFENFLADMGERPSKEYSIDRIDVNGNYEPSNCRWATDKEQCNNRRSNINITYNGETKTLKQWCEYYDMDYKVVRPTYRYGVRTFHEIVEKYKNHGRIRKLKQPIK